MAKKQANKKNTAQEVPQIEEAEDDDDGGGLFDGLDSTELQN